MSFNMNPNFPDRLLVIADWLLPDGDGIYIADRAAARGSRTLVVTGHLSDLPVGTASRHHILMKPTKPESLLALVRALIGASSGPALTECAGRHERQRRNPLP
jgi:DNA-binding response OmpR family regulator